MAKRLTDLTILDGQDHVADTHGTFTFRRASADYGLDIDASVGFLLEEDAHAGLHCPCAGESETERRVTALYARADNEQT